MYEIGFNIFSYLMLAVRMFLLWMLNIADILSVLPSNPTMKNPRFDNQLIKKTDPLL